MEFCLGIHKIWSSTGTNGRYPRSLTPGRLDSHPPLFLKVQCVLLQGTTRAVFLSLSWPHAGEPTYGALFDFSYDSSAYNLIPGRPTQTDMIGSSGCGGIRASYDAGSEVSGEADIVNVGSPGAYASFRSTQTQYIASWLQSSSLIGATIAVHMRMRSATWSMADTILIHFKSDSTRMNRFGITGTPSIGSIFCFTETLASGGTESVISTGTLTDWHTYACTVDTSANTLSRYLDGVLVATTTGLSISSTAFASPASTRYIYITPDANSDMDIKSLYVFKATKTAAQVAALHNFMLLNGTPCAIQRRVSCGVLLIMNESNVPSVITTIQPRYTAHMFICRWAASDAVNARCCHQLS
jgi:hypothetical protein